MLFVQASELPRGALVEYQVNFNSGTADAETDDDDEKPSFLVKSGPTWALCVDSRSHQLLRGVMNIPRQYSIFGSARLN